MSGAMIRRVVLAGVKGGLALSLCGLGGCGYLANRGNDLADIFTVAAETRGLHAGVGVLTVNAAAGYADGRGYGLRNGTQGIYDYSELAFGVFGQRVFTPADQGPRGRKHCEYWWISPLVRNERDGMAGGYAAGRRSSPVCLGNVEASLALGVGVRVGLNLFEMTDFLVGVAGFDLLRDDAARRVLVAGE